MVLERLPFRDNRGSFERLFCPETLQGWKNRPIKQINKSTTKSSGTIRGLHFQHAPYAEAKLITCLRGEVFDVAVDVRYGSPTFGKTFAVLLSESNNKSVIIPEGFAHGFQSLTDNVELVYIHSEFYNRSFEGGVNCFDKDLGIKWPLKCKAISEKDLNLKGLNQITGVEL